MNTSAIVSLSRAHFIPRGSIIFKYFKTPNTNPLKWRCYLPNHPVICLQISSESVSQVGKHWSPRPMQSINPICNRGWGSRRVAGIPRKGWEKCLQPALFHTSYPLWEQSLNSCDTLFKPSYGVVVAYCISDGKWTKTGCSDPARRMLMVAWEPFIGGQIVGLDDSVCRHAFTYLIT